MSKKRINKGNQSKTSSSSRDVKLLAYCAMAGGALVAAQPANAAVVYSGVKDLKLTDNGTIALDLDGGGIVDFDFKNLVGTPFINTSSTCTGTGTGQHCFTTSSWNERRDVNLLLLGKHPENAIGGMRSFSFSTLGAPSAGPKLDTPRFRGAFNLTAGTPIPNNNNFLWFWLDGINNKPKVGKLGLVEKNISSATFPLSWGRFSSGPISSTNTDAPRRAPKAISWTNANIYGTFANQPAGFLGVKFDMSGTTHYGWIRYQGTDEDNATTPTVLTGTIIDWAYQDKPDTPIYAGQFPDCIDKDGDGYGLYCSKGPDCDDSNPKAHDNCTCIDNDGDGYGVGPGCKGPDCDDTDNKTHENCPTCTVNFFPRTLSKFMSMMSPLTGILINGDTDAEFTRTTKVDWGTKNISTVLEVRLTKRIIIALVVINNTGLEAGDTYDVRVGACAGALEIKSF